MKPFKEASDFRSSDLLQYVDVLIDGPYIREQNNSIGLRGSSNQRIINLTDQLREYQLENLVRKIELHIDTGSFTIVGIPTPGIVSVLTEIIHH